MKNRTQTQTAITLTLPAPLHEVLTALAPMAYPMACRVTNQTCNDLSVKRNIIIRGMETSDVMMENSSEWVWLVQRVQNHCELNPGTCNSPLLTMQAEAVPRVPKTRQFTAEDFPLPDALRAAGALKSELKRLVAELDAVGLALLARSTFGEVEEPQTALECLTGALRAAAHDIAAAGAMATHARAERLRQDAPLHDAARKAQRELTLDVVYLERQIQLLPNQHADKLKALCAAAGLTEAEALRAVPAPDIGALVAELADAKVKLQDVALYLEDVDHHTPPAWLKVGLV